ncbi:hypothetical protein GCM10027049_07460 [Mucilaginibacter puniceus]
MKRVYFISTILGVIACLLFKTNVNGQSIPVGTPAFEDYYRRMQLLGEVDPNISFTVRPVHPDSKFKKNIYDPDSTLKNDNWINVEPVSFAKRLGSFQLLPVHIQQQFNSHHPYGWNDEAMIPAKGYQSMVSGGFYLKFGPLSIQLRPEYVYAENPDFEGSNYTTYSGIDLPTRFGNTAYKQVTWGQSSIRLTVGPVSLGLSNESLWWGPGTRNSLILSNNAPGFKHVTFNTVKPIKSFLGYFEAQVIGGHLKASGLQQETNVYTPDPLESRYFAGLNINYHPKWVPGLTLGLIRTFNSYSHYVKTFGEYVPFFYPYQKSSTNSVGDPIPRDQITSVYTRWLFVDAKAEVYFEYGINDNSYDIRQLLNRPDLARAYQFGFRKMVPLREKSKYIIFDAEITQLSQSVDRILENHGSWYTHAEVLAGHTNKGKILGAGIGPGGNSQSIDVSWVHGLKRIGVSFDRYEHEVDRTKDNIDGNSRKWVDFAFGLQGEWNYKNLLFNAKLQHIKSLNYQFILKNYVPGQYYIPHNDVYNFHGELGLTYRF